MKLKSALLAALLALGAGQASAQTIINITGSTAFRAASHNAILAALGGSASVDYAFTGGTLSGADKAIFNGVVSGNPVIVRTNWSGSTEGIADLVPPLTNRPFLVTTNTVAGVVRVTGAGTANVPDDGTKVENGTVQFAFSDVDKAISNNPTATLDGAPAGVIAFRWVASKITGGHGITNITDQLVEALYSTGSLKGSAFTGDPLDDPTFDTDTVTPGLQADPNAFYVLPFGRNIGSGTRATALAETKYGPFRNVSQYGVASTTSGSGSSIIMSDAGVLGNDGQGSGGTLLTYLSANTDTVVANGNPTPFKAVAIGYLGISDSNTAITNGATNLSYNGALYDSAPSTNGAVKVRNGQYSLWGYLQLYSQPLAGLSAPYGLFNTALRTQLADPAVLGSAGIALSQMRVTRGGGDGGLVSPN